MKKEILYIVIIVIILYSSYYIYSALKKYSTPLKIHLEYKLNQDTFIANKYALKVNFQSQNVLFLSRF